MSNVLMCSIYGTLFEFDILKYHLSLIAHRLHASFLWTIYTLQM